MFSFRSSGRKQLAPVSKVSPSNKTKRTHSARIRDDDNTLSDNSNSDWTQNETVSMNIQIQYPFVY